MAPRVGILLLFLVAFISPRIFANKVDEEETCRRYAGGQVYPERTTISEHAVHWSKAQSKFGPFKNLFENVHVTTCFRIQMKTVAIFSCNFRLQGSIFFFGNPKWKRVN